MSLAPALPGSVGYPSSPSSGAIDRVAGRGGPNGTRARQVAVDLGVGDSVDVDVDVAGGRAEHPVAGLPNPHS